MANSDEAPRRKRVANRGSFQPGQCGNPLGRPPKEKRIINDRQARVDLLEEMERPLTLVENGKQVKMPIIRWICRRLVQEAAKGDVRCMLKVLEMRNQAIEQSMEQLLSAKKTVMELLADYRDRPEDLTDKQIFAYQKLKEFVEDPYIVH
jgi:hypothetical protein